VLTQHWTGPDLHSVAPTAIMLRPGPAVINFSTAACYRMSPPVALGADDVQRLQAGIDGPLSDTTPKTGDGAFEATSLDELANLRHRRSDDQRNLGRCGDVDRSEQFVVAALTRHPSRPASTGSPRRRAAAHQVPRPPPRRGVSDVGGGREHEGRAGDARPQLVGRRGARPQGGHWDWHAHKQHTHPVRSAGMTGQGIPVRRVGPRGIEPRTRGLKVRCSAD
jgi:hypothetical protein